MNLSDPRRYGDGADNELAALAGRPDDAAALRRRIAAAVADGDDAAIRAAGRAARTREAYQRLWNAVLEAVEAPPENAAVVTRVFAMPWLLVCGTRAATTLPGVLPDPGAVTTVLQDNGALGSHRNVGFGNALAALETLDAVPPSVLRAWNTGSGARDIPPAPIVLAPGDEAVHLRFLLGAAVAPPQAPPIAETASNIGAWGMKATTALSRQIAVPGVDVLAVPRPPLPVMKAVYAGRRAGLELASNLFVSNTLRRFRSKVGDAGMVLSAHEGGELRLTLHSPLDEGLTEGFRWPLHPLDDLDGIVTGIVQFARECRVLDIVAAPGILPDTTGTGAVLFPTASVCGAKH